MGTTAREAIIEAVRPSADGRSVIIVDQTLIPGEVREIELGCAREMWEAIYQLKVRGAPAIGVCAAWCLAALARRAADDIDDAATFRAAVASQAEFLDSARPTAVNLHWALERMQAAIRAGSATGTDAVAASLSGAGADASTGIDAGSGVGETAAENLDASATVGEGTYADASASAGAGVDAGAGASSSAGVDDEASAAGSFDDARSAAGAGAGVGADISVAELVERLGREARAIHDENVAASDEISRLGASLLADGDGVLTHCNAGPLACLGYGTGQGPLYYAADHGKRVRVFADETRPLLQGARLTSFELARAGIDVTLICDNMASIVMRQGWVQAVMVGCDRVAANGDVANKIGTSGVAILARHYGIPFYVLGPTSTIDLGCATGDDIPIELRNGDEIRSMHYTEPKAPEGVRCYNPSFDVTNHELVSAIVTERGICRPPYTESLAGLFA